MSSGCEPSEVPERSRAVEVEAAEEDDGWRPVLRVFVPLGGDLSGAREERVVRADRRYESEEAARDAAEETLRALRSAGR